MASAALDVLVVGSLHLDILVEAQALPRLDETARGSAWRMVCGGKGGNQAVWAARAGAATAMVSRIGADDFGRRLMANLRENGVDTSAITTDPAAGSGMSVAIQVASGEYGAVIVSGSNLNLGPENTSAAIAGLAVPKLLVLQNEIPDAANIAAARAAKARGARVILNAAPARPLPDELGALVDVLVVNRVEAAMITGLTVETPAEAEAAALKLVRPGRDVIVTLGGEGLVVAASGDKPKALAAEKVKVVSTHGAGDCFIGQLAAGLAQGKNLLDAARLANSTAAAFVGGKLKRQAPENEQG